jgi:hypothetical protein
VNKQIGTLRSHYGQEFAEGCADDESLGEALHKLDEPTLTKLLAAHDSGELEKIRGGSGVAPRGNMKATGAESVDDKGNPRIQPNALPAFTQPECSSLRRISRGIVFLENRFGQVYAKPETSVPHQRFGGSV